MTQDTAAGSPETTCLTELLAEQIVSKTKGSLPGKIDPAVRFQIKDVRTVLKIHIPDVTLLMHCIAASKWRASGEAGPPSAVSGSGNRSITSHAQSIAASSVVAMWRYATAIPWWLWCTGRTVARTPSKHMYSL